MAYMASEPNDWYEWNVCEYSTEYLKRQYSVPHGENISSLIAYRKI